jgi:type IV pilus biogenesis protein CpaD/CtpE
MNKHLLLAVIPLLLAGCASTDSSTASNASREERVYRTGSNLPVRDPVSSSPTTTADPSVLRQGTTPR